ncbi:hypothetical protein [Undibacterium luofuense]|uniref:hypothetical protein n=1 Tax=Undibacterium luofuense TaxID=2828733 RepID=UPI0030EE41B7
MPAKPRFKRLRGWLNVLKVRFALKIISKRKGKVAQIFSKVRNLNSPAAYFSPETLLNASKQPEFGRFADSGIAIRLSSAESLALREWSMRCSAYCVAKNCAAVTVFLSDFQARWMADLFSP